MNAETTVSNLDVVREGPLAVITLNRPQRRNALSLGLMRELIARLEEIGRSRDTRAVILAAAGKVFCSGHDLSEMTGRDINEYRLIFDVCTELMAKLNPFRSRSSRRCRAWPPRPAASWWPPATWPWRRRMRRLPRPA